MKDNINVTSTKHIIACTTPLAEVDSRTEPRSRLLSTTAAAAAKELIIIITAIILSILTRLINNKYPNEIQ